MGTVVMVVLDCLSVLVILWVIRRLVSFFASVFRGEGLVITDRDRSAVIKTLAAVQLVAAVAWLSRIFSSRDSPTGKPTRFRIGDE